MPAALETKVSKPKIKKVPLDSGIVASQAFLDRIWTAENEDGRLDAVNPTTGAMGKYQIQPDDLAEIDWKVDGEWSEKAKTFGVTSDDEFLGNEKAQDAAGRDLFRSKDYYSRSTKLSDGKTLRDMIGQDVSGRLGNFKVTEAGLLAAIHHYGQGTVAAYVEQQRRNGWVSKKTFEKAGARKRAFQAVETRLRTFADATFRD